MRTSLVRLGSILLLLRPFVLTQANAFSPEDHRVERPSFYQVNSELPGKGKHFCVPTAISNHLIALAQKFPGLMSQENPTPKDQVELIKILSSCDYMNTIDGEGTTLSGLVKGLEKYVLERGYDISIRYKGLEENAEDVKQYFAGEEINPEWIKEELKYESNLVLAVNFYKNINGYLKFIEAHDVTVTGFNDNDGFKLHIHDPAEKSETKPETRTCDPVWHSKSDIELGGMKLYPGSDVAFVRYVVAFKIEKPENN